LHIEQLDDPELAIKLPALQLTQLVLELAPKVEPNFPGSQGVHDEEAGAPGTAEKVPAEHFKQTDEDEAPVPAKKVPASQLAQEVPELDE